MSDKRDVKEVYQEFASLWSAIKDFQVVQIDMSAEERFAHTLNSDIKSILQKLMKVLDELKDFDVDQEMIVGAKEEVKSLLEVIDTSNDFDKRMKAPFN